MRIEYKIKSHEKPEYRQTLVIKVWLTDEEVELNPIILPTKLRIDKPKGIDFTYSGYEPELDENGVDKVDGKYEFSSNSFYEYYYNKIPKTACMRLPWRRDSNYLEVEESIKIIKDAVQKAIDNAYNSPPLRIEKEFTFSLEDKIDDELLAYIAAEKL